MIKKYFSLIRKNWSYRKIHFRTLYQNALGCGVSDIAWKQEKNCEFVWTLESRKLHKAKLKLIQFMRKVNPNLVELEIWNIFKKKSYIISDKSRVTRKRLIEIRFVHGLIVKGEKINFCTFIAQKQERKMFHKLSTPCFSYLAILWRFSARYLISLSKNYDITFWFIFVSWMSAAYDSCKSYFSSETNSS